MDFLLLIILGSAVGFLGALLGIGGGVLLVPTLVFFFHIPIHQAVAISLIAIIATSTQVASFGIRNGFTNIRLGLFLEIASTGAAVLSSLIAVQIEAHWIARVFAFTLLVTALFMTYRPAQKRSETVTEEAAGYLGASYFDPTEKAKIVYRVQHLPLVSGLAFIAGVLSGMVGISGGIFKVPIMNLLGRIPIRAAAETSSFMIGFTALGSAIAYYRAGLVDAALVAPIVIGIVVGSAMGNRMETRLKSRLLERLFALILVLTAIKMILS